MNPTKTKNNTSNGAGGVIISQQRSGLHAFIPWLTLVRYTSPFLVMSICVGEEKPNAAKRDFLANIRAPLDDRFSIVVEDENLYAMFEQFLVTQFSQENLHFYREVMTLHHLEDKAAINETALRLCKVYFGHEGTEQVLNVSLSTRTTILKQLHHPTTTMFDEAFHDVEQILRTSYITFLGGPTAQPPKPKNTGFTISCFDTEA